MNRAVSYAMFARMWQIPSGVVTTLLIALCLQPDQQGVYYLILTLTGLQTLADAGLINTILHAVSHEIAHSHFDRQRRFRGPKRARSRLAAIFRFAAFWFSVAAALLCIGGVSFGYVMLARQQMAVSSMLPLFVAICLSALALALSPMIAILEGANQIHEVNRFRLGQVVTGSFVVWLALSVGAGLWAAAAAVLVQVLWELVLIGFYYRRFFVQLVRTPAGEFDWKHEIWPLQWRIGVQSVARYLAFFPIYPVLFDQHGAALAGRYGMTWQIFSNLSMVAYVFVRTKSPEFGRLIAADQRDASLRLFRQATLGSTIVLVSLVSVFCVSLSILQQIPFDLARQFGSRFLASSQCLIFAVAIIPMHLTQCFAMYIRSQRFDPIWRVNLPTSTTLFALGYFAALQGRVEWIAVSILVVFSAAATALGTMSRWYDRHFAALAIKSQSVSSKPEQG
ncbi:hypothetical protein [Rhodopirellula sp. MGV]|uniref:hypothetical protein n=1 Tax=Rhodopirellula sp. MGV TaxID=2023130 RepID=UPI000B962EAE|nr:hypothetical protein [Rhodopirellula sp. MGV]OYP35433.1 hypothetical protein CGZ80_11335 [Rhodopirellula sp. MGV]PNY33873.1 hypothetical protein C2E31_25960 [Rhodopirellula baltica]